VNKVHSSVVAPASTEPQSRHPSRPPEGPDPGVLPHRVDSIDVLRGVAIALVVIGHSIQMLVPDFDANVFFRFIYSFHMPLFFFISGLVSARGLDKPLIEQLHTKFGRLVIPFVCWFLVSQAVSAFRGSSQPLLSALSKLVFQVDGGLWFLWVLFVVTMVAAVLVRVRMLPKVLTLVIASVLFQLAPISLLPPGLLGLNLARLHFPFFALGIVMAPAVITGRLLERKPPLLLQLPVAAAFGLLLAGWHRVELTWLAAQLQARGLPGTMLIESLSRILVAVLGIGLSVFFVQQLTSRGAPRRLLGHLGRNTLEIYATHLYFIPSTLFAGILTVPIAAAFSTAAALLTARILKRLRATNVLLYGKRYRERPRDSGPTRGFAASRRVLAPLPEVMDLEQAE